MRVSISYITEATVPISGKKNEVSVKTIFSHFCAANLTNFPWNQFTIFYCFAYFDEFSLFIFFHFYTVQSISRIFSNLYRPFHEYSMQKDLNFRTFPHCDAVPWKSYICFANFTKISLSHFYFFPFCFFSLYAYLNPINYS